MHISATVSSSRNREIAKDAIRPHRRFATPLRVAAVAFALPMLAACASARVSNIAAQTAAAPQPTEILVAVDTAADIPSTQAGIAGQIAFKLRTTLVQKLTASGITSEFFAPGTSHPGAAVLHIAITRADPGSATERFLIGFGLGQAVLTAQADLQSSDATNASSLAAFRTSGDSGYRPGLVLPGGVALATGDAIHLAIGGGIKIATSLRGGLDRPTRGTADAIVGQLQKYYAAEGWRWPVRKRSWL